MEKLVSLCKRRGFLFQSSEIYGGINGFWDYGPLGVELKRNVKEAWWRDMVSGHDDISTMPGAPQPYEMTGLDCTIIMHPQVWKCSGHYDLFHDYMVDCRQSKKRYRHDQVVGRWVEAKGQKIFATAGSDSDQPETDIERNALKFFGLRTKQAEQLSWDGAMVSLTTVDDFAQVLGPDAKELGTLTEPREYNLMFKTTVGALGGEENSAYLRPETAQGIFVNFKNVVDSSRVRIPFGIAQVGKSFRNEITPRNFTFRSREFEQMEIEFFCHPDSSADWYTYWRNRRFQWYLDMGLAGDKLRLREHHSDELSHYSTGTADIEYAFPFLPTGEYGELEGIAHRGDFDLRSHMEGKLDPNSNPLTLELDANGKPKHRGSGKDLTYRDDLTNERFTPHVVEPSAGADRATLAFLCEAYTEDEAPDENGKLQSRLVMKLHPRIAPIKAAVFPLVKKDGMPEMSQDIYRALKKKFNVFYDEKGAVGRRYRRQDEAGTPFCITVDGQSITDGTVTIRHRDTLEQWRVKQDDVVAEIDKLISE
ncbi:glycine--tRNA ligase [Blastopirellula sp. J2-11]|uniref:glycine--tRNA ligase n=1 Tax=Blastopirellula sp. J2-11 TaxID=2943192 RepID=UPI0021C6C3BC|nr:glycine--tRNA ligase [Blastopirellula sp. J2-11]UUO09225.1 glycine--tRNA ligase [Blastopirellula sp. J2-11]